MYKLDIIQDYLTTNDDALPVYNPADRSLIANIKNHSLSSVKQQIEHMHSQKNIWSDKTSKERADIMMRWHKNLLSTAETLAHLISAESGKPLKEALGEVEYGANFIRWFAEEARRVYGDIIPSHSADKRILVSKQAIGLCAAITPWNFPLAMITRKIAPAIAAGCPIIVKPADKTPLSALALETIARQSGIPSSVFKVVTSKDASSIGKEFCSNSKIKKLSFTGSTQTGRLLMSQSANTIKKLSLELGGNAPFIVFEDAELSEAVRGAMASKFRNSGQTCVCANRFIVHKSIYTQFIAALSKEVAQLKPGPGLSANTNIGPLIDKNAVDKVNALVNDALNKGARLESEYEHLKSSDNYVFPAVVSGIDETMDIFHQEIFGPIATVMSFQSEQEAINIANNTDYGLASYFYTKDFARTWRVMEALEFGIVGVNEGIISTEVAPFGGIKQSGLGREGSKYGIEEYIEIKYCLLGGL